MKLLLYGVQDASSGKMKEGLKHKYSYSCTSHRAPSGFMMLSLVTERCLQAELQSDPQPTPEIFFSGTL